MNERKALPPDPVPEEKAMGGLNYIIRHLGPNRAQRRANPHKHEASDFVKGFRNRDRFSMMPKRGAKKAKAKAEKIAKKSRQDQVRGQRKSAKAARSRKARNARR